MQHLHDDFGEVTARFANLLRQMEPCLCVRARRCSGMLQMDVCRGERALVHLVFRTESGFGFCAEGQRTPPLWMDIAAAISGTMDRMSARN